MYTARERSLRRASSRTRNELVLCASLRIWFFFGHITPCACGVRGASAACDGFGFTRKTAAPFDVIYWLQVTNFDPLFDSGAPSGADPFDVLFHSASKGANHFDVWDFGIHAKMDLAGKFIACPNIGNRRATGYRTKVPSRAKAKGDRLGSRDRLYSMPFMARSPARQANSPRARIADVNSTKAVSFSSARTTKRFPSL